MANPREASQKRIARVAKGKKPQYFADPAVDKLLSLTLTLASELCVARDRLDALERLLGQRGVVSVAEVDQYEPDAKTAEIRDARRAAFLERVPHAVQADFEEFSREDMPRSADEVIAAVAG